MISCVDTVFENVLFFSISNSLINLEESVVNDNIFNVTLACDDTQSFSQTGTGVLRGQPSASSCGSTAVTAPLWKSPPAGFHTFTLTQQQ